MTNQDDEKSKPKLDVLNVLNDIGRILAEALKKSPLIAATVLIVLIAAVIRRSSASISTYSPVAE